MKIIHYIPSIDRMAGGTSTYMQVLAKPLGTMAEVHIMTHASENPLVMENCKVHDIPRYRPFSGVWKKAVVDLLDSVKPDIVHVNCCWMPACAAVQRIAQKRGYKVVLTPHGMLEPWIIKRHYWTRKVPALWLYQKAAVQRADCVQATAESERDNLLKLEYNSNIKVVRLGIDADGIEIKKSWKKTRQILFLSRVHVKKGINFLVEAADVLRNELQGYKILVAGEGEADYVEAMKRMICDRGLQDIVQLIGACMGMRNGGCSRRPTSLCCLPTLKTSVWPLLNRWLLARLSSLPWERHGATSTVLRLVHGSRLARSRWWRRFVGSLVCRRMSLRQWDATGVSSSKRNIRRMSWRDR